MAKTDPSLTVPTASSESQDWVQWHKDLKRVFGKKDANSIWVYAWSKRGGVDSKANNSELNDYTQSQGIDLDRSSFAEITESIGDMISSYMTTSKWITVGVLFLVGIILFRILWKLTQDPNKSIKDVVMVGTPAGRTVKALK